MDAGRGLIHGAVLKPFQHRGGLYTTEAKAESGNGYCHQVYAGPMRAGLCGDMEKMGEEGQVVFFGWQLAVGHVGFSISGIYILRDFIYI